MSYYVEYNPELKKRYPRSMKRNRKVQSVIIGLLLVTVCAYTFVHYDLLQYLIPGDSKVTTAAFREMVESVGSGRAVSEAVFSFCRDIIVGSS